MITFTITHDDLGGTLLDADLRGDDMAAARTIVKGCGFRWSRQCGWFLRGSRNQPPKRSIIDACASQLRGIGLDVTVLIAEDRASYADREAARAAHLADRQDALDSKAERRGTAADAALGQAYATADMIPFGQPVIVGHHSEGRHRRDLDRIRRGYDKGFALQAEATETARRADASRSHVVARQSGPVTERRIAGLRRELRAVVRSLTGEMTASQRRDMAYGLPAGKPAEGDYRDRLLAQQTDLQEQIDYWTAHLASLTEGGYFQWTAAHFVKGDRVNDSATVIRVNRTTLTVAHDVWAGTTLTHRMPFDEVRSRTRGTDRIVREAS